MIRVLVSVAVLAILVSAKIDPEFEKVTCGSAIKLTNVKTGFKLHSHDIPYGSGSGQQSVTGFPDNNDPNSLFLVKGEFGKECVRGEPITCGSTVRIQHLNTGKNLHSHLHQSPISHNQEVSCYGSNFAGDTGDNWELQCVTNTADKTWRRESEIRLMHKDTRKYLTTMQAHQFGNPIPGQLEIFCIDAKNQFNTWSAQEGVYIGDRNFFN